MTVNLHDARSASGDREWLANVYPCYLLDLSEFDDRYYTLTDRGLWEPDHLPSWLEDDTDPPLIIAEAGCRVGLALVNEAPSPHVMPGVRFRMSEFFILRRHRRAGIGRCAAAGEREAAHPSPRESRRVRGGPHRGGAAAGARAPSGCCTSCRTPWISCTRPSQSVWCGVKLSWKSADSR